jgi:hypothetical protein
LWVHKDRFEDYATLEESMRKAGDLGLLELQFQKLYGLEWDLYLQC